MVRCDLGGIAHSSLSCRGGDHMEFGIDELISIAGGIFGFIGGTSIVAGLLLRRFDRLEKKLDRREQDRVTESVIRDELIAACGSLGEANAKGLQAVTTPDACRAELERLQSKRAEYEEFMRKKSAEYLHYN